MDANLLTICVLTFMIHLIATLAFAVRIAGVRTRAVALSFAIFNVLVLVSRVSNSFQGPLLAKRIEVNLLKEASWDILPDLRWILAAAALANLLGVLAIPTSQRLFSRAVLHFQAHRSLARLLLKALSLQSLQLARSDLTKPAAHHLRHLTKGAGLPLSILLVNVGAQALITVGVIATLYAGYLEPDFRSTAASLSAVVNGGAMLFLVLFVDPQLSAMTDDVVAGRTPEAKFRRTVIALSLSRLAGTLLAQALLVPAALLVAMLAKLI
jgi:hypothetical protein